ncbi:hypothetical protein D3C71_1364060 [compost metagenome]
MARSLRAGPVPARCARAQAQRRRHRGGKRRGERSQARQPGNVGRGTVSAGCSRAKRAGRGLRIRKFTLQIGMIPFCGVAGVSRAQRRRVDSAVGMFCARAFPSTGHPRTPARQHHQPPCLSPSSQTSMCAPGGSSTKAWSTRTRCWPRPLLTCMLWTVHPIWCLSQATWWTKASPRNTPWRLSCCTPCNCLTA